MLSWHYMLPSTLRSSEMMGDLMVFDQLMVLYSGDPPLEVVNRYGHGECVKEMVLKYVRKHMADRGTHVQVCRDNS